MSTDPTLVAPPLPGDPDFGAQRFVEGDPVEWGLPCPELPKAAGWPPGWLHEVFSGEPRHPPLAACGFLYEGNRHVFEEECARLLSPAGYMQVIHARAFLRQCTRSKTARAGSYGLKHRCEEWVGRTVGPGHSYVTNGALIAAAILEGFIVKPERSSPNALINVARYPGIGTNEQWTYPE